VFGSFVEDRAFVMVLCGVVVLGHKELRAGAFAENGRSSGGRSVVGGPLLVIRGGSFVLCDEFCSIMFFKSGSSD
jgi:hypothetical protein